MRACMQCVLGGYIDDMLFQIKESLLSIVNVHLFIELDLPIFNCALLINYFILV